MTWAIFDDAHIRALGEILVSGSERVAAIVGGALLDDTLRRTLSERLQNHEGIRNKLLRVNGPMGNMVPKIDMLFMLYAFDKPFRDALYGLSEARNFFAHNFDASFNSKDKKMIDAMKKLRLHEGKAVYPHRIYDGDTKQPIEPISTNHDKFLINLKLCLIMLMRDRVSHETWSNKPHTKKAMNEKKRYWRKREREKGTDGTFVISRTTPSPTPSAKKP